MKEVKKSSGSGIPVIIIGLVLVGVVVGGWWLYSSSKSPANTNTTVQNQQRNATTPVNAPMGANPPNMLGSPTASVTLEEFADFQCGGCAATHPVLKEIQSIYGSKIKFVYRHFPLPSHDKAYDAAIAAEAAGMQGKFWAMQDQLFSNQTAWVTGSNNKQLWAQYAQNIGLDVERWQNDMIGMAAKNRVDQDIARARGLNVSSTPSAFVNGQLVPFPEMNVNGLRRIIDTELQRTASQAQTAPAGAQPPAANARPAR